MIVGDYSIEMRARHNHNKFNSDQGPYVLHLGSAAEPGSMPAGAVALKAGGVEGGRIDSASDADYFSLTLDESAEMLVRAVARGVDIDAAVLDATSNTVQPDLMHEEAFSGSQGVHGFTIRHRFPAGTHYVKVTRSGGASQGPYTIQAEDMAHLKDLDDQYPFFEWGSDPLCANTDDSIGDPLFGCQWNLDNVGLYGGTAGEDINVKEAWATTKGEGVNIAVVDEDFDAAHPDLRENADESLSHDYGNGVLLEKGQSHGTKVAGIIAARDNYRFLTGVAPRATVYGYNYLRNASYANAADAMTRNLDVTAVSNNSWGQGSTPGLKPWSSLWERAVTTGVTEGYGGKGILYVWGVGNYHNSHDNANFDMLTNHYAVTAVCAVNMNGRRAAYSETGASLWVCAPSGDPDGVVPLGITTTSPYGAIDIRFDGTSASAPTVSGVAALVRSVRQDLTWRDVKLILAGSARKNDPGSADWDEGALEYGSTTGSTAQRYWFNPNYGFGTVDAGAALDLAAGWAPLPQFTTTEVASAADLNLSIPVKTTSSGTTATTTTGETTITTGETTTTTGETTATTTLRMGPGVEFVEFIELNVNMHAPRVRDLRIELTSPAGETSLIAPHCASESACGGYSWNGGYRFGSSKHLGENPAGVWTLSITDKNTPGTQSATLRSWKLKAYGHRRTPAAPSVRTPATAGDGEATVFWSAPGNTGASAVTAYDIRYINSTSTGKNIDGNWTVIDNAGGALTRGRTITGLTNDTSYDIQVRAVNTHGDGLWSDTDNRHPGRHHNQHTPVLHRRRQRHHHRRQHHHPHRRRTHPHRAARRPSRHSNRHRHR